MSKNGGKFEWYYFNIYRDFFDFLLIILFKLFVMLLFFKENEMKDDFLKKKKLVLFV